MPRDLIHRARALFVPSSAEDRQAWRPAIDVYRTRNGWLVKCDLAGVRPEDVTLSVAGGRITLRGVRRDCTLEEGCCHYIMEISYSAFERTVELPESLDDARMSLDYAHGMLLVRFQKEAKP